MTYDASRIEDVRQPVTVVELDLDTCLNTYGVAPCTATGAAGSECYNTFASCQDKSNYNKGTKTYRFYTSVSNWPAGQTGFPCLKSAKFTPCRIDPKGSLGKRGVVTVKLTDFADDDLFTDKYQSTRSYNPETQGSFFRKLIKRTPYYKNRIMRVKQGYIRSPFSFNDFEDRLYVIDSIDIDSRGGITIIGKDLLKLADNKKATAPTASTATLNGAITASATSIALQTGEGASFANDAYTGIAISASLVGYAAIGDEVISYTGVSTDTLTGVTRGTNGTIADTHDDNDSVQKSLSFNSVNVVDILSYLLKTYAGVDESYIPYDAGLTTPTGVSDEWDSEKSAWLSGNNLTRMLTKSEGVTKIIESICMQNLIYIWFDEGTQKIKLKTIAPALRNEIPKTISDKANLIKDSVSVKDNDKGRISQIWVYYDIINLTEDLDKPKNYRKLSITIDTTSENANAYDEKSVKVIYADWLGSSNTGLITTLAGRLLVRYADTPSIIKAKIDAKDADFWTGGVLKLDTFNFQGFDGANELKKLQVLSISDDHDKQIMEITGETWAFSDNRYGFITPDTMGDYTAETAANQQAYGFICQNDGLYTNGDTGHLIA